MNEKLSINFPSKKARKHFETWLSISGEHMDIVNDPKNTVVFVRGKEGSIDTKIKPE